MIGIDERGKQWSFEGLWDNGIPVKGKLIGTDGDIYEGKLKDWKPDGYGKYTFHDGTVQEGRFENGAYLGK